MNLPDGIEFQTQVLLDSSMGLDVLPRGAWLEWQCDAPSDKGPKHLRKALLIASSYIIASVVAPLAVKLTIAYMNGSSISYSVWGKNFQLYLLQIYGALWAGWATLATKSLSSSLKILLDRDVIPHLSASTSARITRELRNEFPRRKFLVQSWAIGAAFALLAGVLVYNDVHDGTNPSEVIYWSLGWAILFATSAGVVNVARFYEIFSRNLSSRDDLLFSADPARSSLITSIAYLGQRTLLFWLSIALSIALIVPFSLTQHVESATCQVALYGLSLRETWFTSFYVVLASVFSIGFGVFGFLRSEADLRRVVREVTWRTLRGIEVRAAEFSDHIDDPGSTAIDDLLKLSESHQKISGGGSYRGLILSSASILIPFVAPMIAIISLFIGRK